MKLHTKKRRSTPKKKPVKKPEHENDKPLTQVKYYGGQRFIVKSTPDGRGSFFEDVYPDPGDYEPGR